MKYQKKPVTVEAFKWTGDRNQTEDPEWIVDAIEDKTAIIYMGEDGKLRMDIETIEGHIFAMQGDFIIKGVHGEIYPCKPDIFEETYVKVEEK